MEHTATNNFALVCDLLADLLLPHLTKQKRSLRLSEVSGDLIALIELEDEERLNIEMTAELLNTPDYRLVA